MLRAGPLSSPEVMERLGRDYVNAWVLVNDLPGIAERAADARVRALATLAHQSFVHPVDSQIFSPEGELIDHVCANVILSGNPESEYLELLEAPWRPSDDSGVAQPDPSGTKIYWRRGPKTPPK